MKKYCFFGLFLLSVACAPSSQDADFKIFIKSFYQSKWKQFPVLAVRAGHLKYLKSIPIPNQKKHASNLQFCKKYRDSLHFFDINRLSKPLQFEYQKIKPFLTNYIYDFEVEKIHENDPTYYDLRPAFSTFKTNKLEIIESKLKAIPDYYSTAKQNINSPDQKKLHAAIDQQIQFYNFLDKQCSQNIQTAKLTENQKLNLDQLIFEAKLSVKDFIAFCKSEAFESFDEALNAELSSPEGQMKKVLTVEK